MSNTFEQRRPPSYELFFEPLAIDLDPGMVESIQFAYFASKYGHAMQIREGGGRYFDHPKATAWIGINELGCLDSRFIIDALLHDLSEDSYLLSPYRIALNFGRDIALDVRALTKLPKGKETTEAYLRRVISRGAQVVTAKLCDRLHNLRTLGVCSREKQQRQGEETRNLHLPMLIPALSSHGEVWEGYATILGREMIAVMDTLGI